MPNAPDLTWLPALQLNAAQVRKMDSIDHIDELERIGRALGELVDLGHLGAFATA